MLATPLTTHPAESGFLSALKTGRTKSPNLVGPYALLVIPFILWVSYWWPYQRYNPLATTLFAAICYFLGLIACSKAGGKNPAFVLTMFTLKFLSGYVILWFAWFGTTDWDRQVVYRSFDPATYDAYAAWIVESGEPLHNFINGEDMGNYPYIINLYATLYSYLGSSVLNAASLNSLLVGLGYYFFYRVALGLGARENVSRYLAWMFLVPELVYFTALPGKETSSIAVAAAGTFLILETRHGRDLAKPAFWVAIIVCALFTGVRAHILITVFAVSLTIRFVLARNFQRPILASFAIFYLIILIGAVLSVEFTRKYIPSSYLSRGLVFKEEEVTATVKHLEERGELIFSGSSITRRFIPYTVAQTLLYLPIRTAFFFIAPFPPRFTPWKNEDIGDWFSPMTSFLGVFGTLAFGIMISSLFSYNKHVLGRNAWVPFFWVWATIGLITASYFAIHERYRVFSIPMWLIAFYFGIQSPHRVVFLGGNIALIAALILTYLFLRT